ncbi:MAG TPA: hypothetical protein VF354_01250 [Candidatus Methanoperedens sp.]
MQTEFKLSGAAGTMRVGSMGLCDGGASLRYLWFYLLFTAKDAKRTAPGG